MCMGTQDAQPEEIAKAQKRRSAWNIRLIFQTGIQKDEDF